MAENKETFEDGVKIVDVVTDEENINKEALEHFDTMIREF